MCATLLISPATSSAHPPSRGTIVDFGEGTVEDDKSRARLAVFDNVVSDLKSDGFIEVKRSALALLFVCIASCSI